VNENAYSATMPPKGDYLLLVEDNIDDERLTIRGLDKCDHGLEVVVLRDGEAGLSFVDWVDQGWPLPMLVLLDLKLPKASGFEVLRSFREHALMKEVPVVVLTSSDEKSDVELASKLGANDYMLKPIEYQGYMEAMSSICNMWLPKAVIS
jgi:DNA-binding response OmpR family regulator